MTKYRYLPKSSLLELKKLFEELPNEPGFVIQTGDNYVRCTVGASNVKTIKKYGRWAPTDLLKATRWRPQEVPGFDEKLYKKMSYNLALQLELDAVAKELRDREAVQG